MADLKQGLSIHTFHINIGTGDCAIHLLVDDSTARPIIYRASLVDGGKRRSGSLQQILKTIDYIEANYGFTTNHFFKIIKDDQGKLSFDSVVITHWDNDHYGGVWSLLEYGLLEDLKQRKDLKDLKTKSTSSDDKIANLYESVSGYQCKYFNYSAAEPANVFKAKVAWNGKTPPTDPNTPSVTDINTLKTTLYVPYIAAGRDGSKVDLPSVGGQKVYYKTKKARKGASKKKGAKKGPNKTGPFFFSNNYEQYDDDNNNNTSGLMVWWPYNLSANTSNAPSNNTDSDDDDNIDDKNYTGPYKQLWFYYQCRLAALPQHYIGVDLFGNIACPTDATKIENPAQLIKSFGLLQSQGPRMFIVAGDQVIIGDTKLGGDPSVPTLPTKLAFPSANRHPVKVVDEKHGLIGKGERWDKVRKGSEPLNSASIVIVVLSSSTATPTTMTAADEPKSFELWHFLAGDAIWDVEDAVCRWLTNSSTSDDWKVAAQSAFLKLSHHGALYSCPVSLLKSLKPKFVISPSDLQPKFGHPRPEIIFFLHAMNERLNDSDKMKLLFYNWPIWFCDDTQMKVNFKLDALYKPKDPQWNSMIPGPAVRYLKAMRSYYKDPDNNALVNFWKLKLSAPVGKPKARAEHIPKLWKRILPSIGTINEQSKDGIGAKGDGSRFIQVVISYKAAAKNIEASYQIIGNDNTTKYSGFSVAKGAPVVTPPSSPITLPTNVKIANSKLPFLTMQPKVVTSGIDIGDTVPGPLKLKRTLDSVSKSMEDASGPRKSLKPSLVSTQEITVGTTLLDDEIAAGTIDIPVDDDEEGEWEGAITGVDGGLAQTIDENDDPQYDPSKDHDSYNPSDPSSRGWQYGTTRSGRKFRVVKRTIPKPAVHLALPFHPSARNIMAKDSIPLVPMYICGADYLITSPGSDGNYYQILVGTGALRDFITQLQDGCLKLDKQWLPPAPPATGTGSASGSSTPSPPPPPPPPQSIAVDVSTDDTWMQVLLSNGLGIKGMTLKGLNDGHFAQVDQISASLSFLGLDLVFSSAKSQFVGLPTSNSSASSVDAAFAQDYGLFSLGLDSISGTATPTMGNILNETTIPWLDATEDAASIIGLNSLSSLKPTLINTANSRSSLAFSYDANSTTWLRLAFQLDLTAIKNTLKTAFPFLSNGPIDTSGNPASSDFVVNEARLILLRTAIQSAGESIISDEISFELDLVLGGSVKSSTTFNVTAYAVFDYATTKFALTFDTSIDVNTVTKSLARMAGLADSENAHTQFHPDSLIANANKSDITFSPLQASITLSNPTTGSTFGIQQVSAGFALQVYGTTLSCKVKYTNSSNFSLAAELWINKTPDSSDYALVPFVESYDDGLIALPSSWQGTPTGQIDFAKVIGTTPAPPDSMHLQTLSGTLSFSVSKSDSETVMQFEGHISSKPLGANENCPKVVLGDLALDCYYSSTRGYDITLTNTTFLLPRTFPADPAIALGVTVEYSKSPDSSSSGWIVGGTAANITFAALFSLFDADSCHAVMDFMEKISIPRVYVEWDHSSGSAALSAGGSIMIGPFELDFSYDYGTAPEQGLGNQSSHWSFTASLGSSNAGVQPLSALISALSADPDITEILADIPFVADIQIPAASGDDGDDPLIQFCITKAADGPTVMWVMLSITTTEGTISFTYVQLQAPRSSATTGTDNKTAAAQRPVGYKSAIRVMLDKLPQFPNVPVIGVIDQPFDSIDYVHVSDTTTSTTPGFTTSELDLINSTMGPLDQIPYRKTVSSLQNSAPNASGTTDPPVLLPGHHFIMTSNGNVLLDHIFGGAASSPTANPNTVPKPQAAVALGSSNAAVKVNAPAPASTTALSSDSGSTMAPLSVHVGQIFSIQSIGLQSKDGYLYILISATIALGPIQLTLEGFGVGIKLSALKLSELSNLKTSDFSFILSGMSVDFNQPPVMIAGVFIELQGQGVHAYMGGLAVSILPYTLLAVGEYCDWGDTPPDPRLKDLKSVFVFARLDGPLFSLEFAEISGVEVGFGYNYVLTSPAPADISQFPLVHGVTSQQQNPMTTLQQFGNYNQPCPDSLWFAVGFKVDAFEILTVDAAALVNFSSSGFSISIIGIASASMPPSLTDRREMFVYVELGIIATLDIIKGNLTIGAQLTPNSFVLYPDCHLTGGFALYYWFSPSPHAGDWVFTIGGYHPAFKPPDYYPVVPRLGISWDLSDCLSIRGESFFAITPKVCMGGGRLLAVFNAGPIYAHFEAWASFLMTFKPFFFIADIGVSLSVGFHCDIGLIHIDINVDIGADLHLQGPKFGGVAHVNLWILHFSVYFGDQDDGPAPLDWNAFVQTVQQQRTGSDTANDSSALVVVAIEEGSANEKLVSATQKTGDEWYVRGGSFKFRVECKIPIQDMTMTNKVSTWLASQQLPAGTIPTNEIHARLMGPVAEQAMSSSLSLVFDYPAPPSADENPFQLTAIIRNMPNAMWDKYNTSEDPNHNGSAGNSIDSLLSPDPNSAATTRPMLVGFHIASPKPSLPAVNIPEFNAVDEMSEGVFQDGNGSTPNTGRPLLAANPNDERPCLPSTPDEQSIGRPEVKSAAPTCWTNVISAWSNKTDDGTHLMRDRQLTLCNAWTSICGWTDQAPTGTTPGTSGTVTPTSTTGGAVITAPVQYTLLKPQRPSMILGLDSAGNPIGDDLMNFGNYYLSCPPLTG